MLAEELKLGKIESHPYLKHPVGVFSVPYDKNGKYDPTCKMTLDFREGAEIRVGNPEASNYGAKGVFIKPSKEDRDDTSYCVNLEEKGRFVSRLLGGKLN